MRLKIEHISKDSNTRLKLVVFWLVVFLAWIMFAFSTDNPDYKIYETWYNYSASEGLIKRFELGYSLFYYISTKLGFSYQQFIQVYSAIGMIILGKCICDYAKNPLSVLFLYLIYPFFFDVVQLRNFMAEVIILFGIRYLAEFRKKDVIRFVMCVLLAAMFHKTALFYFVFLLAYVKSYKKVVITSLVISVSGVGVVLIAPSVINKLATIIGNPVYIDRGSSIEKIIGYGIFGVAIIVLSYLNYLECSNNREHIDESFIMKLLPIICISVIIVAITSQGYRLFRNMSVMLYIAFINDGGYIERTVLKTSFTRALFVVFVVFFALFFNYKQLGGGMYDEVVYRIINSNEYYRFIVY